CVERDERILRRGTANVLFDCPSAKLNASRRIYCRASDNHGMDRPVTVLHVEPCAPRQMPSYPRRSTRLFLESLEPFEIQNRDVAIAHAHEADGFKMPQGLVYPLPREAARISQFFL